MGPPGVLNETERLKGMFGTGSAKLSNFDWFCVLVFPALLMLFVLLYKQHLNLYLFLLEEDGAIEWVTFVLLCIAATLALRCHFLWDGDMDSSRWGYTALSVFLYFCALEEISWGQRFFNFESSQFFLDYSTQQEVNVHNVLQNWSRFKTKHIAAIVLFGYGVILPFSKQFLIPAWAYKLIKPYIPPRIFVGGFLIGTLLMLDRPTGMEEEIGELVFSLSFLLFIINRYKNFTPAIQLRNSD